MLIVRRFEYPSNKRTKLVYLTSQLVDQTLRKNLCEETCYLGIKHCVKYVRGNSQLVHQTMCTKCENILLWPVFCGIL